MAFTASSFAKLSANANPDIPNVFVYSSADTVATVNTADYFLNAYADFGLKVGDMVLAHLDTGGTPQAYLLTINAASATSVDVADGTALGTTDSD